MVVVDTMHFVPIEAVGTDADATEIAASQPWSLLAAGGLLLLLLGGGGVFAMTKRKQTQLGLAGRGDGEAMLSGPDSVPVGSSLGSSLGSSVGSAVGEGVALAGLAPLASPLAGLYELIDSRPEESLAVIRAWIADGEMA
jgi:flagellar M-ring protein FliF